MIVLEMEFEGIKPLRLFVVFVENELKIVFERYYAHVRSVLEVGAHFKNAVHHVVQFWTLSDPTGYINEAIGTKRNGKGFIEFFSLVK